MLKNSRVGKQLDTQRLAQALAGPGIDTRTWVSLAIVNKVFVDAAEGVFADVTLMPSRIDETCRVAQEYAGNGFGFFTPIEVDDEVLVEAPSGDPDEGLILTRRLYSASDPPPSEAVAHPQDVLMVIKEGQSIRLIVKGAGKVVLATDNAEQESVRGTIFIEELGKVLTDLSAFALAATSGPGPYPNTVPAKITAYNLLLSQYLTDKVVLP